MFLCGDRGREHSDTGEKKAPCPDATRSEPLHSPRITDGTCPCYNIP